jgi:hypothetical protein
MVGRRPAASAGGGGGLILGDRQAQAREHAGIVIFNSFREPNWTFSNYVANYVTQANLVMHLPVQVPVAILSEAILYPYR